MSRTLAFGVRPRIAIGLLALMALAVRLLHVASYDPAPTMDGATYVRLASERLTFERILSPGATFDYPPGYPIFLKPFLMVFGEEAGIRAAAVAQAGLGAWTCVLIYGLARRLHSRRAGLAAALLACFYPHFLFYSSVTMSEALFIPMYLASLLALLRAAERTGRWRLYRAGLAAGATTLVRPVAFSLFPAALLAAWSVSRGGPEGAPTWRRRALALSLIAAGGLTVIGPWAARNRIVYGVFVLIAPYGAFNLAAGNLPDSPGGHRNPPDVPGGLGSRMAQYRSMVWDFVSGDPWGALFIVMRLKWLTFWNGIPPWPLYSSNPCLFYGEHFFPYVSWRNALLLGAVGLGTILARRRAHGWVTPACLAAYVAFYLVYFGDTRYRLPVEGIFLAWGGVAIAEIVSRFPRVGRSRAPAWAAAVCVLLGAVAAEAGASAAGARAFLRRPESFIASAGQIQVDMTKPSTPIFGPEPIRLDRGRGRYLRMDFHIRRLGPDRDWASDGRVSILFQDRRGEALPWQQIPSYALENLPRGPWVRVPIKTHIPPAAVACKVVLTPNRESPDELFLDQSVLRYSHGNDLALEFLYPYLRFEE